MNKKITVLIAIMILSVSIAGCTGDLENDIDKLENQIQDNQAEMSDLNSTIDGLQKNVEELNVTIVERESQITDLLSQITEYQLSITSLNNQNDTNMGLINQLTLNITSLELTITELGVQIVALQDAKTSLEVQIGILESAKSALEDQVSSLSSTNQDLIIENQNSAMEISELQAYASTLNATISELLNTISEMEDESESENWSSTLDTILDRGNMKCGVKGSQYGMAYSDPDTGERFGLDISYCRAIAAAIGLDPENDIEYIDSSGSDRFERLANGSIDVLIRTTTWTTSRDADLDANFGAINFYDGQGILINTDEFPDATSALDLDGASICVAIGSTSAGNIEDYFEENNMSYQAINTWQETSDFVNENCDAITGDMSALVAAKWQIEENGWASFGMSIMPELLSKEPLASVTRDYDTEWNEVVSWVWYGMITAEELGVTSDNYQNADTSKPSVDRLLNYNLGLGTDQNPLSNTWMQSVLEEVGNYGEAYDDAFCDGSYDGYSGSDTMTGCLISRTNTLNALVSEGGLQYSPPMR
jgi:general L-amino acid transport system substrate-binding protein